MRYIKCSPSPEAMTLQPCFSILTTRPPRVVSSNTLAVRDLTGRLFSSVFFPPSRASTASPASASSSASARPCSSASFVGMRRVRNTAGTDICDESWDGNSAPVVCSTKETGTVRRGSRRSVSSGTMPVTSYRVAWPEYIRHSSGGGVMVGRKGPLCLRLLALAPRGEGRREGSERESSSSAPSGPSSLSLPLPLSSASEWVSARLAAAAPEAVAAAAVPVMLPVLYEGWMRDRRAMAPSRSWERRGDEKENVGEGN